MLSERWKTPAIIGVRAIELISLGFVLSGFLWSTADLMIIHVLAESPVAPLSVLFMLYGTMGTLVSEFIARRLGKETNSVEKK